MYILMPAGLYSSQARYICRTLSYFKRGLARYCGGSEGQLLAETERFVRARGSTRSLGSPFWEAVCHEHRTKEVLPFYRHALLKLALTNTAVLASDAKKATSAGLLIKAKKADELLSRLRSVARSSGVLMDDPRVTNIMGVVDCNVIAHVLGIRVENEKKYASLEGLAHDATLLLSSALQCNIASPWAVHAEDMPTSSGSKASTDRLIELNADGSFKSPEQMLTDIGIQAGMSVRRKKDRTECTVTEIQGSFVRLLGSDGRMMKCHMDVFLQGAWVPFVPKAEIDHIGDLGRFGPAAEHAEWTKARIMALIQHEMHDLCTKHDVDGAMEKLQLQLRPHKCIQSAGQIAKQKLVLVPYSWKISAGNQKGIGSGAHVMLKDPIEDLYFAIQPTNVMPKASEEDGELTGFLCPYFLVQTVDDPERANMSLHYSGTKGSLVRLPLLKNHAALSAGEILTIHKDKAVPAEDQLLPISPKRRKIGKQGNEE